MRKVQRRVGDLSDTLTLVRAEGGCLQDDAETGTGTHYSSARASEACQ